MWALIGILTALHSRHATGEGRLVDISMTDGAQSFLHGALAAHVGGGGAPPARGADTLTGGYGFYAVYETRDGGFFTVAALEPKFWRRFCDAIGLPELTKRQFGSPKLIEQTRQEVAAVFRTRTRDEWTAVFAEVDACCEPVLRPEELMAHPLHRARTASIEDRAGMRRLRTPLRDPAAPPPGAAPGLGEHSRQILAELGHDEEGIAALIRTGVVAASIDSGGEGGDPLLRRNT